ncbi:restriction endonuclease [Kitasatospora sp. YST-16]|uniref:restriction endonuclease n=1 Tax=Kitasatospora sp. YST-16 TaxID=2998080 RepID=UPI002284B7AF|nr:restriction endonuclease [Kitasatospora sp. YST-16]WAL72699.1 restriction endonuclease [Kitasatospora sp. YST-16]WNW38748.1 restriction endonuclease [Streptomyces sp. Li-HN-5-13]
MTNSGAADEAPDAEPRVGDFWDERLDEWLETIAGSDPPGDVGNGGQDEPSGAIQDWSFPTDALRDEYLTSVGSRSEDSVLRLLRRFLFEDAAFDADFRAFRAILCDGDAAARGTAPPEYVRRLRLWMGKKRRPHPGVRWCLDLLPFAPKAAIDVIHGYLAAHFWVLPDGRIDGLGDAMAIIRARWLGPDAQGRELLFSLSPRELEQLTGALYEAMGYRATLTPPQRDGGRDVVAVKEGPGQRELVLVECKGYSAPVGVEVVRALLGVVAAERANKGVLVTCGRFTRGAVMLAAGEPRLELISGDDFSALLSSHLGTSWHLRRESVIERHQRRMDERSSA